MLKTIFYLFAILFLTINCEEKVNKVLRDSNCKMPVQKDLRWEAPAEAAQEICCSNYGYAEPAGFWDTTTFIQEEKNKTVNFYDSVTGKHIFTMPIGRTWAEFKAESEGHGWPSLRDAEANMENIIILPARQYLPTFIDITTETE